MPAPRPAGKDRALGILGSGRSQHDAGARQSNCGQRLLVHLSLVLIGVRRTSGERMQPSGDSWSIRAELEDRPHVVASGWFGAVTPGTAIRPGYAELKGFLQQISRGSESISKTFPFNLTATSRSLL
ncbi:hypothetical protein GOODEAATRI_019329 [Goodea atripinnis]|uniref:Uncharacterized protein n=1 Tax=Goodea atripinnis TaxID=208336 RepID=A0ABV0N2P1_9TELE